MSERIKMPQTESQPIEDNSMPGPPTLTIEDLKKNRLVVMGQFHASIQKALFACVSEIQANKQTGKIKAPTPALVNVLGELVSAYKKFHEAEDVFFATTLEENIVDA